MLDVEVLERIAHVHHHHRGQMRLALPHLLGASKRTQLTLDKKEYVTNEKVNLYARLYTEGYAPPEQIIGRENE